MTDFGPRTLGERAADALGPNLHKVAAEMAIRLADGDPRVEAAAATADALRVQAVDAVAAYFAATERVVEIANEVVIEHTAKQEY